MSATAWIARIVAIVLVVGAIVNLALEAANLLRADESSPHAIAQAIENTLPLLGLAAALLVLGSISESASPKKSDDYAAERVAAGVEQMRSSVMGLQSQLNRLIEQQDATSRAVDSPMLDAIASKVNELRELLLLDPQTRQAQVEKSRGERRSQALLEGRRAIRQRRWSDADELLKSLEIGFAGDPDVINARLEYTSDFTAYENDAISRVRTQARDFVATGAWEQAHEAVAQFVTQFPANLSGQQLLEQIRNERSIADESTAQEIFEEIRNSVDSRQWRAALMSSNGFLERFPAHRRAEAIRLQLPTIQGNAEIEHRQESEAQIQELLRTKRYSEAIKLAEALLDQYPRSPQAGLLLQLLPKMREMADGERRSRAK